MTTTPPGGSGTDARGQAVQRAEDAALPGGGRRFATLAEVRAHVEAVVGDPWWQDTFPWAPVDVEVRARSASATWSAAHVAASGEAVVFLRRGSWDAVTVVHELAHVAARSGLGERAAHDGGFTDALEQLWRRHLGVHAWAALVEALDREGLRSVPNAVRPASGNGGGPAPGGRPRLAPGDP